MSYGYFNICFKDKQEIWELDLAEWSIKSSEWDLA